MIESIDERRSSDVGTDEDMSEGRGGDSSESRMDSDTEGMRGGDDSAGGSRGRVRKHVQLDTLVLGTKGLLEHMGLRQASSCEVPWKNVLRVERDRIVVRRNERKRSA
jgi:hypothetical protein